MYSQERKMFYLFLSKIYGKRKKIGVKEKIQRTTTLLVEVEI